MEAAAAKAAKTIWEIAAFYTDAFKADLKALNIISPTIWSVATDHIQDMIAFARVIEQAGASYELDNGLYFDTSKVPDYGRLAGASWLRSYWGRRSGASPRSRASAIPPISRCGAGRRRASSARWNGFRPGARARRAGISNAR